MNPPSPDKKPSFGDFLDAWEKSQEQESHGKGQLTEGTIVYTDRDYVFIDVGEKQEGIVPISEFYETPKSGAQVTLVKKKRLNGGAWLLSKREADIRQGWETVRDAFQNSFPLSGKIVAEVKGKGFHVVAEGITLFLPASHVSMKYKKPEELKLKEFDFKIIELNEKTKTGVVSRKKLLEEQNSEKWDALLTHINVGDKIKATVQKFANFGVFLDVEGVIGLLRQNDISYKKYAPFKHLFQKDQEVEVEVLAIDKENNKLSLGYKQLFEDPWEWAKRELTKETIIRGVVTSITNFGVFVELKEGLEGLVHTSELTWSKKPPNPKEIVKKGDEIEAMVLDVDYENRRLSLGLKQLQPNPWDSLSSNVRTGAILEGKITGITKYGAFVEVENGIEGLIHISDITWDEKDKNPANLLKKGDTVQYKILDVNIDAQRISCGLKQLNEHPLEALRKKYPPGSLVNGKIKSVVQFGIFLEIEDGYEGLVHISEIPDGKNINLEEKYHRDEMIQASVVKIDPQAKKISLSIKDFDKALEREEIAKYMKDDETPSTQSLGSFVNLK